jgi:hypothetical protein
MWDAGFAYEQPTLVPPIDASESSSSPLLPSPQADESTPTDEYIEEMRVAGIKPDERLYLPGRRWFAQRTLSRIAPALLPTPVTDPDSANGHARNLSREVLLPTPAAADGERGTDYAAATREGTGGDSLTTAAAKLLPTPTARDDRGPNTNARAGGQDLPSAARLLPTPLAGDARASGSRNLPGSKAHKGVSLTDAILTGDSETPRLLPTSGEPTSPPFAAGNSSSDDQRHGQLTIEDDSPPSSSSG